MRPELLVFSRSQFEDFIRKQHNEFVAVRIINPNSKKHLEGTRFIDEIRLEFWDIEDAIGHYEPILLAQAKDIVQFLLKNKEQKRFVFHCEAGESRSHTCALFLADKILGDDILVGLLSSNQKNSINFALWNTLCEALRETS
ncbi:MAG: hypothetical protein PHT07_24080 [Paludibacter sp.]|nr:hypothetical protein [Paludibacter sp.]